MSAENTIHARLKTALREKNWAAAIDEIRQALFASSDPDSYLRLAKSIERLPRTAALEHGLVAKRIAILGGYTTSFLRRALIASLFKRGIFAEVWEGEYGLFEATILTKDQELAEFAPDICFFSVGTEHVQNASIEREVARWLSLWSEVQTWLGCAIVQNSFVEPSQRVYGNYELKAATSRTRFVRRLNLDLAEAAPGFVHFADVDYLAAREGRRSWRDEKFFDLAKISVAHENLLVESENAATVIAALFGRTKKCLILDLDNTLWGGVIGDDGLGGIKIGEDSDVGEAYKRFQSYVRDLKNRGVILAVCSKNEEVHAREPFEKRTDMVLKLEDISCFVANWEPKHLNIQRIARELNIGLDACVFVDDNPAEREIVRQNLPEVTVVDLPLEPAAYAAALADAALFEIVAFTKEDGARTEQYVANRARAELETAAGDYGHYLQSLQMSALVRKFDEENLPRIVQLINKTNQFNLTTQRYLESEVRAFTASGNWTNLYVKLRDRFGDNGLIAVMMARHESPDLALIENWLMSCRVLKREVETLLLRKMLAELRDVGIRRIQARYLPTKKNGLVAHLLPQLGFSKLKDLTGGGEVWEIGVDEGFIKIPESPIRLVTPTDYANEGESR